MLGTRHSRRTLQFTVALVAATLAMTACTSSGARSSNDASSSSPSPSGATNAPGATGKKTIGLVSYNITSPGIKLFQDTFKAQAQKLGWKVEDVDTAGDAVAAVNQTKQWIGSGIDAIVVNTIPNNLLSDGIKAAKAKGVPWMSVASGEADGITTNIGANEVASGAELTSALIQLMGGKGNILQLTWSALPAVAARNAGMHAVVASTPGVKVVKTIELKVPGWADDAYNQVTNYLQSHKDVNAIWMPWDDFTTNVVRAVDQAGMKDKIIVGGFDLDPSAADQLRAKGPFQVTNALNIPSQAVRLLQLLEDKFAGKSVPSAEYVPNCLATPQNIPAQGGREQPSFWKDCYSKPLNLVPGES